MSVDGLELLLRALALAWALAAALVLVVRRPRSAATALGAFCACGVAAFLCVSTPIAFAALGPAAFMLDAWCLASPIAFWMLARTLFEDGFTPSRAMILAAAAFCVVESAAEWGRYALGPLALVPAFAQALFLALRAACMVLVAHGVHVAIAGRRGDLVDARRAVRLGFALLAGGAFAATVASTFVFPTGAPQAVRVPGIALLALAMLGLVALVATGAVHDTLRAVLPASTIPPAAPRAVERPDVELARRLVELMQTGEPWREERLSLAALALRVGVPEYRLRRAIHHELGHRHFSTFLAQYRLEAAAGRLADVARADDAVLDIAFECGFNSIGPFNRAFRARFGATPTEYRAAVRARALAESSKTRTPARSGETSAAS
jgi:AraC-like DNA-binding protein